MKAQIRTAIKAKLSDMTESEWEAKCRSMRETLFSLKEWKQARDRRYHLDTPGNSDTADY